MEEKETNDLFKSMLEHPVDPRLKELGALMVDQMKDGVRVLLELSKQPAPASIPNGIQIADVRKDQEILVSIVENDDFFKDLASKQKPLDEESNKILHDNYWDLVEKSESSVNRDAFQREILGTFVTYDIDQFESVKYASYGNDYDRCDNCKEEKPLALYLCTRRDKTTDHRLYCRKCVRNHQ